MKKLVSLSLAVVSRAKIKRILHPFSSLPILKQTFRSFRLLETRLLMSQMYLVLVIIKDDNKYELRTAMYVSWLTHTSAFSELEIEIFHTNHMFCCSVMKCGLFLFG